MKHYIYNIDGKVLANPEEMPNPHSYIGVKLDKNYISLFNRWLENCIEVENVKRTVENVCVPIHSEALIEKWQIWIKPEWSKTIFYHDFENGQQVEMEGNKITKLL